MPRPGGDVTVLPPYSLSFFLPPIEVEDLTSARQYYMKTKDAEGTLRKLPPGRPLERALLQGLAKREGLNDYLGALKCVSLGVVRCFVEQEV